MLSAGRTAGGRRSACALLRRGAGALLVLWASFAVGCAGGSPDPSSGAMTEPVSPVVRGSERGLEVRWWVVGAGPDRLGADLGPHLDAPLPVSDGTARLWRSHGFRLISVPLPMLDGVRDRLRITGAVQRHWLGQAPFWTEIVAGSTRRERFTIALDTERLSLRPGRLRLLARAWAVPLPPGPEEPADEVRAALHVEVIPQHQERSPRRPAGANGAAPLDPLPLAPEEEGLLFRRLLATMTVREGDALLIVPASPEEAWPAGPASSASSGEVSPEPLPATSEVGRVTRVPGGPLAPAPAALLPAESSAPAGPFGPPSARAPTFGEALLTAPSSHPSGPDTRVIVVLIPRVPDRFELTPR